MTTNYLSYIKGWDITLISATTLLQQEENLNLSCVISYCKVVCPVASNIQGLTYTNLSSKGIYLFTAMYDEGKLLHYSIKLGDQEEVFVCTREDLIVMLMVELNLEYEEAIAHINNVLQHIDLI
jgi:hypothetical protein